MNEYSRDRAKVPWRESWRQARRRMEAGKEKHTPRGKRETRHWGVFKVLLRFFAIALKLTALYNRGVRNALDIRLRHVDLDLPDLPAEFDGFTILHLSDLHVDARPAAMDAALVLAGAVSVDLCVLTGDYRWRVSGPFNQIMPAMRELARRVSARHGLYAVLGNHDSADMAEAFEDVGITLLLNETMSIHRDGAAMHVTGTDDVHYFYTDAARAALEQTPDGFKIALVHSPELADTAADNGFHLYLAGHTHGGQVCLPGGRPIITHLSRFRDYAAGTWRHGAMRGYTSTGVGTSGLPVRFNCRGEVALITLRRRCDSTR